MKRLSFLVSLTNDDNDYQQEQAAVAEKAARRLGVDVKIIHANNDALAQSQQLLQYVQTPADSRPECDHIRTGGRNRISAGGAGGGRGRDRMGCAES